MHGDDDEPRGGSYTGATREGLRHGVGTYVYANPYFTYEGSWHKGVKHGKGRLALGDGSVFEGDFALGEIEGSGTRTWPNGASYSGQFKEGDMDGKGTRVDPDGSRYEGDFVQNARHGFGKLTLVDGSVFEGDFDQNRQSGRGTLVEADGATYEGDFLLGARHGYGRQTWPDGASYAGDWSNDRFDGDGEYAAERRSYQGKWVGGQPTWRPVMVDIGTEEWALPEDVPTDEKPTLGLVVGGPCPTVVVACRDEEDQPVDCESGRLIRATLRRYFLPEPVAADPKKDKGAKKPPGKHEPAPAPAAPPELLYEVVVGEALSQEGFAIFDELSVPAEAAPSSNPKEYELTFTDETPFDRVQPRPPAEPTVPIRPLMIYCTVAARVDAEDAPSEAAE